MLVLALDTSTPLITVTLATVEGDPAAPVTNQVAHTELDNAFAHAEQLMPLVKAALHQAGQVLADVRALVVGVGPGPFTGLRVGIATAAALGDGLGIPVFPVPSHEGIAAGGHPDGPYLVVTDARRKEVFITAFDGRLSKVGPLALAPTAVQEVLSGLDLMPEHLLGPGADLVKDQLPMPVWESADNQGLGLIRAAAAAILTGQPPAPLTPLYLRRPDAVEPSKVRKSVLGR